MNLRCVFLLLLTTPGVAWAQTPARLADLPKQAASWPLAWGALAREVAEAADFEKRALAGVDKLLKAEPSADAYRYADIILTATLRHHLSVHRPAPLADEPLRQTRIELQDRLAGVRQAWLESLGNDAEALRLADVWLSATPADSPLRSAIQQLWIGQAKQALAKENFKTARGWLNRLEADADDARAEPIRKALRERAAALLQEAQTKSGSAAQRLLEEALEYWPRLPDGRDALEREKKTYRTLVVGVPALPTQISPATAWTEVEKQTLPLLFDVPFQPEQIPGLGFRYRPDLAAELPIDAGRTSSIALRHDAFWSSGERVTAADVRHTALLMNKEDAASRSGLWREFLDVPRPGAHRFQVDITRRQGLLDPLAPLTFWVLPQYYRGKQLQRLDDADFAKAPVGSGPFQFVGRKAEAGKPYLHFQANPHDLHDGGMRHLREIRMFAWTDAKKDLPTPLPELIVDAPTDQLTALKGRGYVEVRIEATPAVQFLALNQRRPGLTSALVRRAIGHGLDRQGLLRRHFQGATEPHHATANGLFPRQSWASCPAPRVPAELYQHDLARSLARKAKAEFAQLDWTLKYAAGNAPLQAACEEMAGAIAMLFSEAGIKASVKAIGLTPAAIRKALAERDYDLLYLSDEHLDDPVRLALLFDPSADALRAGGSNYLDCDDVRLQELLQSALRHRQFAKAQAGMHAVHVHLNDTMPAVPLWQLDLHVLALPSLHLAPLTSRQLFSRIRAWNS